MLLDNPEGTRPLGRAWRRWRNNNVKSSCASTEYHAVETYWGSGGIAPLIL